MNRQLDRFIGTQQVASVVAGTWQPVLFFGGLVILAVEANGPGI